MYTNRELSIYKTSNRGQASIGKFKIKTIKDYVCETQDVIFQL